MNWNHIFICIATATLWSVGMFLAGLSLGFRVGTQRTVLIFRRHFPDTRTLLLLTQKLLHICRKLDTEAPAAAPPPPKP